MSIDNDWEFAHDFMSDEEIAEILAVEAELGIDLADLEEELESENDLMDSADAESDWAD
jgi:hypothetical protein